MGRERRSDPTDGSRNYPLPHPLPLVTSHTVVIHRADCDIREPRDDKAAPTRLHLGDVVAAWLRFLWTDQSPGMRFIWDTSDLLMRFIWDGWVDRHWLNIGTASDTVSDIADGTISDNQTKDLVRKLETEPLTVLILDSPKT